MTRPKTLVAVWIAVLAATVYALMWVGYCQHWAWLSRMDWSVLDAARDIAVKHPLWLLFWQGVSYALGPVAMAVVGIASTVFALMMRSSRSALLLVFACGPLNQLATTAAKALVNRPRPATMLVDAPSSSFPSGHALEAMSALLAALSFFLPMMSRSMQRIAIAVLAVAVPAVGVSRVALNVHYPSDVLAGWSLGYLYFLLCVFVFRPWIRRPAAPRRTTEPVAVS